MQRVKLTVDSCTKTAAWLLNVVNALPCNNVRVNPNFRRTDNLDDETQKSRIDFEMKFALESTAPSWVSVPSHFIVMNNGRAFNISVDASKLPHGVHTAKVCGYDAEHPERGVMWSLPITVVKPMPEQQRIHLPALSVSD